MFLASLPSVPIVRSRAHRCRSRFRRAGGRAVGVGRTACDDATLRRPRPRPSSSPSPPHSTHARPLLLLARFKAKKKKKLEGGVPAWLGGYLNRTRTPARLPIPISTLPSFKCQESNAILHRRPPRVPTLHIGHLQCHPSCPSPAWRPPPARSSPSYCNSALRRRNVAGQRARDRLLLPPLQRGCRRR